MPAAAVVAALLALLVLLLVLLLAALLVLLLAGFGWGVGCHSCGCAPGLDGAGGTADDGVPAAAVPVAAALAAVASMATPAEFAAVPVPVPPSVELPAPIGIVPDCAAPMTLEAAWSARDIPPVVAADRAATARRARLAGPLFETGAVVRFAVAGVVLFAVADV